MKAPREDRSSANQNKARANLQFDILCGSKRMWFFHLRGPHANFHEARSSDEIELEREALAAAANERRRRLRPRRRPHRIRPKRMGSGAVHPGDGVGARDSSDGMRTQVSGSDRGRFASGLSDDHPHEPADSALDS